MGNSSTWRVAVIRALQFAAVTMLVLVPHFSFPVAQAQEKSKDSPDDFTRVYNFTYDDVFQAANEVLFRHGGNIKTADKEKGLLSSVSNAVNGPDDRCTTDIKVEAISPAPETRVTYHGQCGKPIHHKWEPTSQSAARFFGDLQKILSTYK